MATVFNDLSYHRHGRGGHRADPRPRQHDARRLRHYLEQADAARVFLQFIALVLILLAVWFNRQSGG